MAEAADFALKVMDTSGAKANAAPTAAAMIGTGTAFQILSEAQGRITVPTIRASTMGGITPYRQQAESVCIYAFNWATTLSVTTRGLMPSSTNCTVVPLRIEVHRNIGYDFIPHVRLLQIGKGVGSPFTTAFNVVTAEIVVDGKINKNRIGELEVTIDWQEKMRGIPLVPEPVSKMWFYGDGRFECEGVIEKMLGEEGIAALQHLDQPVIPKLFPPKYRVGKMAEDPPSAPTSAVLPGASTSNQPPRAGTVAGHHSSSLPEAPRPDPAKVAATRDHMLSILGEDFHRWLLLNLFPITARLAADFDAGPFTAAGEAFDKQARVGLGAAVEFYLHGYRDLQAFGTKSWQRENLSVAGPQEYIREIIDNVNGAARFLATGLAKTLAHFEREADPRSYTSTSWGGDPARYEEYLAAANAALADIRQLEQGLFHYIKYARTMIGAVDVEATVYTETSQMVEGLVTAVREMQVNIRPAIARIEAQLANAPGLVTVSHRLTDAFFELLQQVNSKALQARLTRDGRAGICFYSGHQAVVLVCDPKDEGSLNEFLGYVPDQALDNGESLVGQFEADIHHLLESAAGTRWDGTLTKVRPPRNVQGLRDRYLPRVLNKNGTQPTLRLSGVDALADRRQIGPLLDAITHYRVIAETPDMPADARAKVAERRARDPYAAAAGDRRAGRARPANPKRTFGSQFRRFFGLSR